MGRVLGEVLFGNGGVIMMQRRVWKLTVLCLTVSAVLLLGRPGAQAQTPAAAGKAKVDRLVMGLIEKYRDYWRPWINGSADHMIQHDPAFEWLFEVDPESGKYNPWLAESSEMAKDGRSWRIKLRKGCSSTTAMASSPPKMSCTIMPCGATRNTRAAKTRRSWVTKWYLPGRAG